MKVVIVNGGKAYHDMFVGRGYEVVVDLSEADLVCFTGGHDVNPGLYHQMPHPATHFWRRRDDFEMTVFRKCLELGKPMVGICRGGQFLNVMNKGSMYQDVNNHCGNHVAATPDMGTIITVSSTHHQMMIPAFNGVVRLVADMATSKQYCNMIGTGLTHVYEDEVGEPFTDTEAVFYPNTKCYCFQPHPEFDGVEECRDFFFKEIEELLGVK